MKRMDVSAVKRAVKRRTKPAKPLRSLTLNCDLGESFGAWRMGHDEEVMPLIDCANVACGFHGGDPAVIARTVKMAKRHKVELGAHVAYPDLQGFGRRSMVMDPNELVDVLHYQISALDGIARSHGTRVSYVKPHGALYNDMLKDELLLETVMRAVASWYRSVDLVTLATSNDKRAVALGINYGVRVRFEAFADRGYSSNGHLLPRNKHGALLDLEGAVAQAQAIRSGTPRSASGRKLSMVPDTLCVHGDTPGAVAMIKAIRAAFDDAPP